MPELTPGNSEPVLAADFSKGEQFWKFWMTPKLELPSGEVVRIKALSKKLKDGRFQLVSFTETEDGTKIVWAEEVLKSDQELVAFVKGVYSMAAHLVGSIVELDLLDFTGCDSWEKWNYKFREGTTIKLWNSEDGTSLKGNV